MIWTRRSGIITKRLQSYYKKVICILQHLSQEITVFSLNRGRRENAAWGKNSLEGFVHGSIPAEEGARAEEDEPEDGQAEVHPMGGVHSEVGQASQHVQEQGHAVNCRERTDEGHCDSIQDPQ